MAATISKSYRGDTEMWFIRTDQGYETFIEWDSDGPGGPSRALATREPEGAWVWRKTA